MLHKVSAAPGISVGWSRLGTDDDKVTSMIVENGHEYEVASVAMYHLFKKRIICAMKKNNNNINDKINHRNVWKLAPR